MSRHIELNNEVTQMVDGFYDLEKDKQAIAQFWKEAQERTMKFGSVKERYAYLVANDYYYKELFDQYSIEEIEELDKLITGYDFEFQSYMAISKFYTDYAMQSNDKKWYLEYYEDRIIIVALYLAQGNIEKATEYAIAMIEQRDQPATPTFLNAGKSRRGELVSCFLLEIDDSLNSIGFNINTAMQLSKIGGGVALNLSKIRARGETIKQVENASSGVLPVMKLLEDSFSYANQLGQRKGAGATYLNIFHWDLIEFLETKKINADEKSRIQSLSIGLIVPDKFMELAAKNEPYFVFAPRTVFDEYNVHLDDMDMDIWYDILANNEKVKKKVSPISARDLLVKIAQTQLESGYPYLMYKDTANAKHALKDIGQIKMSNLCTEIFQLQETSIINDYGIEDEINRDVNCNLGSLNIVNVMEHKAIKESVHTGIDMLTQVSLLSKIGNAPTVKKSNEELHSVGLGAMNLHGFYAKNGIPYESEMAIDFARTFFMMMNFHSIEKSMLIAKEQNQRFKDFHKSEYAKGTYFKKYLENDYSPKFDKVIALFDGIYIPTKEDWKQLMLDVKEYGMFNSYRLAIAPTQSISYIQNATQSVMPITHKIEPRTYKNSTTYYPMPYLARNNFFLYKVAYDMDMYKVIDLIAEIQEHIDQGISTILYVNSDIATNVLARYYIYAHKKGLKSLYYTRTRKLDVDECESCSV